MAQGILKTIGLNPRRIPKIFRSGSGPWIPDLNNNLRYIRIG